MRGPVGIDPRQYVDERIIHAVNVGDGVNAQAVGQAQGSFFTASWNDRHGLALIGPISLSFSGVYEVNKTKIQTVQFEKHFAIDPNGIEKKYAYECLHARDLWRTFMRRANRLLLTITAFLSAALCGTAEAGMFGLPKALKPQLERIKLDTPALSPMAYMMFCVKYPRECEVRRMAFRGRKLEMTPERWTDLQAVNVSVNRNILPEANTLGVTAEKWLISPVRGDCNDYAVTKRHQLLARGWPSRSLLLAEVVVPSGEHHLVVVVRTAQGDFILDNLSPHIKPWSKVPYQWVRMQVPSNPLFWSTVRTVNI